jgi:hypothetical protein
MFGKPSAAMADTAADDYAAEKSLHAQEHGTEEAATGQNF